MLTANNTLFSSTAAASGSWRNIQNWINFSLHITGLEGNVWVEVSNDPSVLTNGATINAPAAPVLTQYTPTADSHLAGVPTNTTYYVKNTYVTSNGLNPTGGAPQFTTGYGETTASTETSLLVTAGNLLVVKSPAQDAGGVASGWNTYISKTTGTETLQNLEDNAIVAPCQFGQTFILTNYGLMSTAGSSPPVSNTSGTANSGVNLTGNLTSFPAASYTPGATGTGLNQIQVIVSGTSAMINPSGIIWNFIRVCKSGGGSLKTQAFLFGQSA